jgi:hypothetical protein
VHPVKLVIAIVTTSLSVLLILVTINYVHTGFSSIGEIASYLGLSSVVLFIFFCCFDEILVLFGKSIEK